MTTKKENKSLGWQLVLACLLGLFFLAACYLRLWGDAGSAAFGGKIIDAALAEPILGTALGANIVRFAAALVLLHVGLGIGCLVLAHISKAAWPTHHHSPTVWLLLWFILATVWLLVANASWFPSSSLGAPYSRLAALNWNGISPLVIATLTVVLAIGTTIMRAVALIIMRSSVPREFIRWIAPGIGVMLLVALSIHQEPVSAARPTSEDRPHIVLIGLDSLRTDAVLSTEYSNTPFIDEFLRESARFTNASTPLARTFPSWVSIISGRHPHSTGAVMNLLPRHLIETGETLPQMLRQVGYKSLYAIDEVRFSNLDTSYGFDQMLAPPIGATDFLVGFFADTPLSNVLMNSWIGEMMFPYVYANRAAALTYDPDSFVERLDENLRVEGPSFIAIHLTLAHWPYTWAGIESPQKGSNVEVAPLYNRAVSRLDQQFADVMNVLRRRGALDNAIVVVLSDHGESLGSEDGLHDENGSFVDGRFDTSRITGHGTSVFAPDQYQVVLGIRTFGRTPVDLGQSRSIEAPVTLEDIAPSIADALSLEPALDFDGTSLLPLLRNRDEEARMAGRIRFTETEFNPPGITPGKVISASSIKSAASYYRVDPTSDRVTLRDQGIDDILSKRQYAAFRKDRVPCRGVRVVSLGSIGTELS